MPPSRSVSMWQILADQWQTSHSPDRAATGHAPDAPPPVTDARPTTNGAQPMRQPGMTRGVMEASAGTGDGRTGPVTAVRAAAPDVARAHFARLLELETDGADVASDLAAGTADFVLL